MPGIVKIAKNVVFGLSGSISAHRGEYRGKWVKMVENGDFCRVGVPPAQAVGPRKWCGLGNDSWGCVGVPEMTLEHFLAEFGRFWPVFGLHGCSAACIGNIGESGRKSKKPVRSRKKSTFQKLFLFVLRVFWDPLGGCRWVLEHTWRRQPPLPSLRGVRWEKALLRPYS